MKVGLIGLGKMGFNLALNMIDHDIEVFGYDKYLSDELEDNSHGIKTRKSIKELVAALDKPSIACFVVL